MSGAWGYTYVDWLRPDGSVGSHVTCTEQQAREKSAHDLAVVVIFREMPDGPWRQMDDIVPPEDFL